jgi:hypothetical protein
MWLLRTRLDILQISINPARLKSISLSKSRISINEKIAVTITTMSFSNHISSAPACDDSSRFRWLLRTLICRI